MKLFKGETDVRSIILYAPHESAIQTLRKTMNTQHARLVYIRKKSISKGHKKEDMGNIEET